MDRTGKLALLALAGVTLYLYTASQASASTDGTSTGSTWLDQLNAALADVGAGFTGGATSIQAPGDTSDIGAGYSGLPTAGEASAGLFDRITGALNMGTSWKTGEYPTYAAAIAQAEIDYGIPTDLLARQLYQECHYRADIISGATRSAAGAVGIAQFMPRTAAQYGVNPLDPFASIDGAARMMADLYRAKGNWPDALASYNWGSGNVAAWKNGARTMPAETQNYVAQITADVPVA